MIKKYFYHGCSILTGVIAVLISVVFLWPESTLYQPDKVWIGVLIMLVGLYVAGYGFYLLKQGDK